MVYLSDSMVMEMVGDSGAIDAAAADWTMGPAKQKAGGEIPGLKALKNPDLLTRRCDRPKCCGTLSIL